MNASNFRSPEALSQSPAERLRRMHEWLATAYGPQHWWPAETAFEVILGAYLTQNTAWKAVERSLANLRAAGALSLEGLRSLTLDELRELIRPSGFHTRKGPAIKAFSAMLDEEYGGSLERLAAAPTAALRRRLLALPGVGPETADAILLYALNHPVPVADEYLRRIAARHGLLQVPEDLLVASEWDARSASRAKARIDSAGLMRGLKPPPPSESTFSAASRAASPARISYESLADLTREAFAAAPEPSRAQLFNEFHALTVAVGKAHCGRTARCARCPLAVDLQFGRETPGQGAGARSAIASDTLPARMVYRKSGE